MRFLFVTALVLSAILAGAQDYTITKIPSNPAAGFSWPYYLSIPASASNATDLLVESNNSPFRTNNWAVHDAYAVQLASNRSVFASALGVPLLVPSFHIPRDPWYIYTSQLNRAALTNTIPGLERYDLQLIAMIDDARARLAAAGIHVNRKVFLMGFSASGFFANRFSLLHPDRVKAVAVGAPGACTACTDTWQGEILQYPVGIEDVYQLIGLSTDATAIRSLPMYFYMGDQDTHNDPVPSWDCFEPAHGAQIFRLFGTNQVLRWPKYQELYDRAGCHAQFVMYPGVGHNLTPQMLSDIRAFFEAHRYASPIVVPARSGSSLELSWCSDLHVTYEVQCRTSLITGTWSSVGATVPGNGEIVRVTNAAAGLGLQFYRVNGTGVP